VSQSNSTDGAFFKTAGLVLGALVLFTGVILIMANIVGEKEVVLDDITRTVLAKRVAPAGSVRTSADAPAEAEVAAAPKTPEELYAVCAACHDTGAAGAPLKSDAAAWAERTSAAGGMEGLISSAITGKGGMPARGGSAFSDEEMATVVKFLAGQ